MNDHDNRADRTGYLPAASARGVSSHPQSVVSRPGRTAPSSLRLSTVLPGTLACAEAVASRRTGSAVPGPARPARGPR